MLGWRSSGFLSICSFKNFSVWFERSFQGGKKVMRGRSRFWEKDTLVCRCYHLDMTETARSSAMSNEHRCEEPREIWPEISGHGLTIITKDSVITEAFIKIYVNKAITMCLCVNKWTHTQRKDWLHSNDHCLLHIHTHDWPTKIKYPGLNFSYLFNRKQIFTDVFKICIM